MEYRGIAVDLDFLHDLQKEFADGVAAAAAECYAVIGREVNLGSPKQLQAVLFDELGLPKTKKNKTGYTTDADALTSLLATTGHPFLEHLLRHRDVTRLRTVIDGLHPDGRRRRPHPHHVPADDRGDRPALLDRPEPAEHPDPHRRGPADPAGVRRRPGLRVADDGGLQPDRDADHGPPVRRRGPDRGLHVGGGPALLRRLPGLRHPDRRGRPGDAPPDQGDELRPGLRAVAPTGCRSSCASPPRRRASRCTPTSSASAASATTSTASWTRPGRPATPRPRWAGAATCPT